MHKHKLTHPHAHTLSVTHTLSTAFPLPMFLLCHTHTHTLSLSLSLSLSMSLSLTHIGQASLLHDLLHSWLELPGAGIGPQVELSHWVISAGEGQRSNNMEKMRNVCHAVCLSPKGNLSD